MATINRAPWTALVDDSGQNLDGSIWNKAAIQTVLLDPIDAAIGPVQTGVWTPYTPTWNTSGAVQPVIGNGTLAGEYALIGKTCHFTLRIIMGTTTTYGDAGIWFYSLPLPGIRFSYGFIVTAITSAGSAQPAAASVTYSTAQNFYGMTPTAGLIGPTVPFTWNAGAALNVRGTYQIA